MNDMRKVTLVTVLVTLLILCEASGNRNSKEEQADEDVDTRLIDDSDRREEWRAITPSDTDNSGSNPPGLPTNTENIPKRRRPGRKRRRRIQGHAQPRRPLRLDEDDRETWHVEDLEETAYQHGYKRRRLNPRYFPEDSEVGAESAEIEIERIRDPYSALDEEDRKSKQRRKHLRDDYYKRQTNATSTTVQVGKYEKPDIKSLLKQTGKNISLSELLQQKNLSLADLLRGEQHAISALTEIPESTTEMKRFTTSTTVITAKMDSTTVNMNSDETAEEQRRRISISHGSRDNKLYSDVIKMDVVTEATTERRIFVPSHPKYYTSVDFKPIPDFTARPQTTKSAITTHKSITERTKAGTRKFSPLRPRLRLPATAAKIRNSYRTTTAIPNRTETTEPAIPLKAIEIDINELFGYKKPQNVEITTKKISEVEGPLKISVNIEELMMKDIPKITTKLPTRKPTTITQLPEKLHPPTAEEELMQILNDSKSGENLQRILRMRNMTLAELVEQRERGSSQRHLADIFHNQTREPNPKEDNIVDSIMTNAPISYKSTSEKMQSSTDSTRAPRRLEPMQEKTSKDSEMISVSYRLPAWKPIPTIYGVYDNYLPRQNPLISQTEQFKNYPEVEENEIAEPKNEPLNNSPEESYSHLPYGVRSAVVVSTVIVGTSLLIFLTIFVVFRWSQKRNKHLNYSNSFSEPKIKMPILESRHPKRLISTLMSNATLGKKKMRMSNGLHGLSDCGWESEKKPFQ